MLGRLHVIIDVAPEGRDPASLLAAVIAGGAPVVQLRPKLVTDREAYETCARLADQCRAAGVTCIVNDRVDLARAVGADGVHVGLTDLPIDAVVRFGGGLVVGGTARDAATAAAHERDGAGYLGIGPIYATSSKTGLPEPLGPSMLTRVAGAVSVPIIAISGISVDRIPEVLDAGAHGVAVIGAVARADDPEAATRAFVDAIAAQTEGALQ
jgi:thiamine-phosphate pyrophosphorylase